MTIPKQRVAIVGGGVAGLVAARILHDQGVDCRIFERSQVMAAVGAGIQLSPNGVRILHRLGLADALAHRGVLAGSIETRRWHEGDLIAATPHGVDCEKVFGAPYCLIHRADLQKCLLSLVPDGLLELGRTCVEVVERPDEVELRFADGSAVSADVVIGADGVHSVVRQAVVDDAARYSGYSVHRGLVPADMVPSFRSDPRVLFWLGPGRHVTYYPIAGGKTVHFSAVGVSDEPPDPSSTAADTAELAAAFTGWHEDVLRIVTAADSVTRWGLFDRDIAPTYVTGRVALVGDAAHPTLPYMSQGANQALEDVVVLAACLTAAGPHDPGAALRQYEAVRRPRTAHVHQRARLLAESFHLPDGARQAARDLRMKTDEDLTHLEWLYGYDAGTAVPAAAPSSARRTEATVPSPTTRF